MRSPQPRPPRVLLGGLAVVVLLAGACAEPSPPAVEGDQGPVGSSVVAGDEPTASADPGDAAASPEGTETSDGATSPAPGAAAGATPTTAAGSPTASPTAAASPSGGGPSGGQSGDGTSDGGSAGGGGQDDVVDPVPAGTYAYDTDGWNRVGEEPREDLPERTTLEVTPADGDDVQHQVRDTRDGDGYGSRNTLTLRYGVEGAVLLRSTLESTVEVFGSPFTSVERLEARPPVVIAPNGGGVGHQVELHLESDEVVVDGTLEVVRREQVDVGGEPVDAFVVVTHLELTGRIEGTSDTTAWVRPDDLLVLREQVATDVTSRGLRYREQYDAVLRSTVPV